MKRSNLFVGTMIMALGLFVLANTKLTSYSTVKAQSDPSTERLETVSCKPKKKDINLKVVALAWTPHWQDERGDLTEAY